jgi:hypothetical protein
MHPVHELPAKGAALMGCFDGEQVQMGAFIAELHDGESRELPMAPRGQDHAIGALDVAKYAVCWPGRRQSDLDEAARQRRNGGRVAG